MASRAARAASVSCRPVGVRRRPRQTAGVAVLAITALAAVPLHRRLSHAFDPQVHRRLLTADTARLIVAVLASVLAARLLVR